MIDINVTLLVQMANFLILLFLMNLILYRPIRRIVAQRRQLIADRQETVDRVDREVASAVEQFNLKLQEARKLGRQKIQEAKAAAYEQEKNLLQKATEEAGGQVQEMRASIKRDIEAARTQLSGQIQAFSAQLAQKILGRSL